MDNWGEKSGMTWKYKYNGETDETVIYWNGEKQAAVEGEITNWFNGYPQDQEAREAVADAIQSAGTPKRIRMQFDLNYGFENTTPVKE